MARIAYILLCHKDPPGIVAQARRLTATGDAISIHFDARAPREAYEHIRAELADNPRVTFARRRIRCGWGEWSLVAATLEAVRAAVEDFPDATHFYMISGDCMPIKSARFIHEFLDAHDRDYIESFDFFRSDWIKTGLKEERLIYRHFVNERERKWLFYTLLEVQKRLGLKRRIPADLDIMIGSQWWCLRRRTVEQVLEFTDARPDVRRFFATTWIPDETYFQTLVRHLIPETEIECRTPTFLIFSDYGMPVNFYNDHYEMLLAQDYLFARKISAEALELRARLGDLYGSDRTDFPISGEGRRLYQYVRQRGRIGLRYGRRFWEREASLGRERTLYVIVCKKWHVAKRLLEAIGRVTDKPGVAYLFNELSTPLPPLGGVETTLEKRTRHRRALLRLLYEHHGSNELVMCLDTSGLDILRDVYSDRAEVRTLEVLCEFDDDYLIGHARRVGLASERTPEATIQRLLPSIRAEFDDEVERLRDADFPNYFRIRQDRSAERNAEAIAEWLDVDEATALELARTPYLFDD